MTIGEVVGVIIGSHLVTGVVYLICRRSLPERLTALIEREVKAKGFAQLLYAQIDYGKEEFTDQQKVDKTRAASEEIKLLLRKHHVSHVAGYSKSSFQEQLPPDSLAIYHGPA